MKQTKTILVRESSGTYIARVAGAGYEASCTAGPERAATRCAEKWYGSSATIQRAPHLDTFSRGNAHGTEDSIRREAYILTY